MCVFAANVERFLGARQDYVLVLHDFGFGGNRGPSLLVLFGVDGVSGEVGVGGAGGRDEAVVPTPLDMGGMEWVKKAPPPPPCEWRRGEGDGDDSRFELRRTNRLTGPTADDIAIGPAPSEPIELAEQLANIELLCPLGAFADDGIISELPRWWLNGPRGEEGVSVERSGS